MLNGYHYKQCVEYGIFIKGQSHFLDVGLFILRYQSANQKPYIEEGKTKQWAKAKQLKTELNIKEHEPHKQPSINSCAQEG